jgi:agmatine deiminase
MWSDLAATERSYAAVAHAIARFEPVIMLVPPGRVGQARDLLGSDVELFEVPHDDSWARDSGPSFVCGDGGDLAGVCFTFNAWGNKYQPHDQDALMGRRICERAGVPAIASALVAEGGGLCVDGEGTLITTDSCFPNANRNPAWDLQQIEEELKLQLGVEKVLWLPGDPLDQETDGHVDGIAAFARPGAVILPDVLAADDERRPFFASVQAAAESMTDARGRPFELLTLPEAPYLPDRHGERHCLSYINFYIANGGIVAPAYGVTEDDVARERLQSYFPGREVVLVPIDSIAEGGGGIHCITQQQPAPVQAG